MSQLNTLLAGEIEGYSPGTRDYTVLGPVKAIERLARHEGWVAEKIVIRHLANGNDEHLHVLSRSKLTPMPTPTKNPPVPPAPLPKAPHQVPQPAPSRVAAATARVKEAIRGDRKP